MKWIGSFKDIQFTSKFNSLSFETKQRNSNSNSARRSFTSWNILPSSSTSLYELYELLAICFICESSLVILERESVRQKPKSAEIAAKNLKMFAINSLKGC